MSGNTIRRARAVHPIADLQIEYSLASRGPESQIFPVLDELGISATLYGVLSRGLLTGSKPRGAGDFRSYLPRFSGDHADRNHGVVENVAAFARERGMTPAQVAVAWARAKAPHHVTLVGARTRAQLSDALATKPLSPADVAALESLVLSRAHATAASRCATSTASADRSTQARVLGSEVTRDSLLGGAIELWQPKHGYRVNVDSVLLAAFASGRRAALAVDLGAGVGALSLLAHHHGLAQKLGLVEREPELVELARKNVELAGARAEFYERDLEARGLPLELRGKAGLVLSNPPFFDAAEHRPPKSAAKRAARLGGVAPFLRAASLALAGDKARAVFVYPARGLEQLFASARAASLVPKRLRFVHARADRPARVALVELRRAKPGGLVVEPPLVEWERSGRRSAELESYLR